MQQIRVKTIIKLWLFGLQNNLERSMMLIATNPREFALPNPAPK